MERREFLLKSAAGVFTTGLAAPLPRMTTDGKQENPKIIYQIMGRTGLKVPVLSFGVMNTDSPELIKKALEMGCLLYTSPSPRDRTRSRMPSSA